MVAAAHVRTIGVYISRSEVAAPPGAAHVCRTAASIEPTVTSRRNLLQAVCIPELVSFSPGSQLMIIDEEDGYLSTYLARLNTDRPGRPSHDAFSPTIPHQSCSRYLNFTWLGITLPRSRFPGFLER